MADKTPEIDRLVRRFADAVRRSNEELDHGSAAGANRAAKIFIQSFRRLIEIAGDSGRDALAGLFNDMRVDVRGMAAAYLLGYRNEQATRILTAISQRKSLTGFEAGECLKRWKEGVWELDPDYLPPNHRTRQKK